jgi:hypothetical protein
MHETQPRCFMGMQLDTQALRWFREENNISRVGGDAIYHATLLGLMKPGERQMSLPCLLHLPDTGTLRITSNPIGEQELP